MGENKTVYQIITDDPADIIQFRFVDQNGKITKQSIKTALKPPYPLKYYLTGILGSIGLTVFLLWNFGIIPGKKLGFFCNDYLFSHKYNGDTVTPVMLGIGIGFLYPLIYLLVEYIRQIRLKNTFSQEVLLEFYLYFKQFNIGMLLVGGATEIAKTIVGEHRPHFFYTCLPDGNFNCTNGTYIPTYTCTNPNSTFLDIIDASRSFPSGHSSLSWFAALYSAYTVHVRLPIKRTGTAFKLFMLILCLSFGLVCSLTRITDRRHHWWDVLIGSLIGALGAAYISRVIGKQISTLTEQLRLVQEQGDQNGRELDVEYNV